MRVSQEWLGDFVDLGGLDPKHIAELLTRSGTEVEHILTFGAGLEQVRVARAEAVERLTGSDHLWLAHVRAGREEPVEVVCGAPNLTPGAVVAWAAPGATLPSGLRMAPRRIRGTWSQGMICALDELGLGSDHEGVLLLPETEVELGQPLSNVFPPDTVYQLEVLSHRPDCLSHLGVARELAAVLDRQLREPALTEPKRVGEPAGTTLAVDIQAEGDCPLYLGERVEGLVCGPSPLWVQRRLLAVGARPLFNIVDLANYVMLELGQPLHTFDWGLLHQGGSVRLGVRRGHAGETLECLDGVKRSLGPEALLITAQDQPVALAGIIGGGASAVRATTTSILLEAASFNWVVIRGAERFLGLRTDASSRFERALAPALAPMGAHRFLDLIHRCTLGTVRPGPVQGGRLGPDPAPIRVSSSSISRLLGLEVAPTEAAAALSRLGFGVQTSGEDLEVVPSRLRTDVGIPADLAEEVGRILGYDRIPATLPAQREVPPPPPPWPSAAGLVSEICRGAGFSEAITLSLVGERAVWGVTGIAPGEPSIELSNPLSPQLSRLRQSCLPGLLDACRLNQNRGRESSRLFEWGRVFWWPTSNPARTGPDRIAAGGTLPPRPEEPQVLALVDHEAGTADVEHRLERLLQLLQGVAERASQLEVVFRPAERPGFLAGRCAEVVLRGRAVGVLGQVDPDAGLEAQLRGTVVAAEVRVDGWLEDGGRSPRPLTLAKTPQLEVDLAVTVPEAAGLGPALAAVTRAAIPELERVRLTDEYRGAPLSPGSKSWTFHLVFRHPDKTLSHRQGQQLRGRVLEALASAANATERTDPA
ncbi:MAG: phenylalanine--tRNA ligase subunit beta [Candidatus Dormibacteria bacterium]